FALLFSICAFFGLTAFILASRGKYKKTVATETHTKVARFDVLEKTASNTPIRLSFITLTSGGTTSLLRLYAEVKEARVIQYYFITYAAFLMISRLFAGKIYDKRGDLYVIPPGVILIFIAMLLLSWLPSTTMMLVAGALYGLGFGMVQPALQAWAVDKAP